MTQSSAPQPVIDIPEKKFKKFLQGVSAETADVLLILGLVLLLVGLGLVVG